MSDSRTLPLAVAQYDIGQPRRWDDFAVKLADWVARGAEGGARLLVFPEYGAMELTALFAPDVQRSLPAQLEAMQALVEPYVALHRELARRHGVYLLAASLPVRVASGEYRNRAHLFGPSGAQGHQDKLQMTRFENERWGISPGAEQRVFVTPLGRLAVAVCYDSEFPLLVRRLVEHGAEVLLVPSCTDTLAGYHRVRLSCQARALENQCFAALAPTVGMAEWSLAVDENHGAGGIYAPVEAGLAEEGIVAQGVLDQPGWVRATLNLDWLRRARQEGQVFNHRDWPGQHRLNSQPVTEIPLE